MAEKFEYTREWTNAEAFPLLGFSRDWNNPADYPTVELDEKKVREDMQSLHDEVKDYINTKLIPAVLAADATEEARAAAETARANAEAERQTAEEQRASAETVRQSNEETRESNEAARVAAENLRASAETAREQAESSRVSAETGRDNAESSRVGAEMDRANNEQDRVYAESTRISAEIGRDNAERSRASNETARVAAEQERVSAETARADETSGIVAQATEQATIAANKADDASISELNAKAYANGGLEYTKSESGVVSGTFVMGAKDYADQAKAYAEGGLFDPDPHDGVKQTVKADGAKNMADKAKAFAESGTYKEYEVGTTSPGSITLVTKTVSKGAKQYAEDAAGSAAAASVSETNAKASETASESQAALSKSWAVGGTGTRPGEDSNNAKYWAEQSQARVQPDWNQNNETAPDYIKNRICYKEFQSLLFSGDITLSPPASEGGTSSAKSVFSVPIGTLGKTQTPVLKIVWDGISYELTPEWDSGLESNYVGNPNLLMSDDPGGIDIPFVFYPRYETSGGELNVEALPEQQGVHTILVGFDVCKNSRRISSELQHTEWSREKIY